MGSIVFNPNTQQPESVSVKTGSYTIPVGYYAYVTASVAGSDTFSIGGVVALQGVAASASAGTGGAISSIDVETTGTTTASYTVPSGYKAHIQAKFFTISSGELRFNCGSMQTGAGQITTGYGFVGGGFSANNANDVLTNQAYTWVVGTGEVVSMTNSTGSYTKNLVGYAERPNSLNGGQSAGVSSGSFWIAENTVLTTSGGQYTVSLYKNIV